MANKEKEQQKKPGVIQLAFYIVIIPGMFALMLAAVILYFLDINPLEIAEDVPVVGEWIADDGEEAGDAAGQTEGPSREELLATIESQESEIDSLESEVESQEETIAELNDEVEELTFESEDDAALEEETQEEIARLARVYENMSADDAAAILTEMSTEEILLHMSEMTDDGRADILSEMESDLAAEIMSQFAE
ncbi:flagellar motility protein MotE (MotC chaperone) [Salsuginibacillus halophilus]|uniref:Flagellar motility protein MotE (MotC chaperone) n=1 Tax=Salsuginibacillus halophilus TaxID=517424 RepID=A0A2P8HY76_9BACI|nr:hypothetical protein [Salsuginibacillus halophilus]PSL51192.1 flagellar motility protein MotE (MotC chaperone) [Salsuginibacillus halophilus]